MHFDQKRKANISEFSFTMEWKTFKRKRETENTKVREYGERERSKKKTTPKKNGEIHEKKELLERGR